MSLNLPLWATCLILLVMWALAAVVAIRSPWTVDCPWIIKGLLCVLAAGFDGMLGAKTVHQQYAQEYPPTVAMGPLGIPTATAKAPPFPKSGVAGMSNAELKAYTFGLTAQLKTLVQRNVGFIQNPERLRMLNNKEIAQDTYDSSNVQAFQFLMWRYKKFYSDKAKQLRDELRSREPDTLAKMNPADISDADSAYDNPVNWVQINTVTKDLDRLAKALPND